MQNKLSKMLKQWKKSLKKKGSRLIAGGTDNTYYLLILKQVSSISGKKTQHLLNEINITANKNAIPFDTEKPFSKLQNSVGTPAMTTKRIQRRRL